MPIQLTAPNTYTAHTNGTTPATVVVFVMSDETVGSLEAIVSAIDTSTGVAASWKKFACVKRHAGMVSVVSTILDIIGARKDPGAITWTVDVTVSGNNVQLVLTGGSLSTIEWMITSLVQAYTP